MMVEWDTSRANAQDKILSLWEPEKTNYNISLITTQLDLESMVSKKLKKLGGQKMVLAISLQRLNHTDNRKPNFDLLRVCISILNLLAKDTRPYCLSLSWCYREALPKKCYIINCFPPSSQEDCFSRTLFERSIVKAWMHGKSISAFFVDSVAS